MAESKAMVADEPPTHLVQSLLDCWSLERLLGSGSQGQVWLARGRFAAAQQVAAVKLLRNCSDARHEVEAYEQLRRFVPHPHILDVGFGLTDGYMLHATQHAWSCTPPSTAQDPWPCGS